MNGFINYLLGYSEYSCPENESAEILNGLIDDGSVFFDVSSNGENVTFSVLKHYEKKSEKHLKKCRKIKEKGLFFYLSKHKNRAGLLAGALFCAVCVFISSRYVWDIEVEDKENEEKIIEALKKAGLEIGSYIPDINEDIVEIKALLSSDEFSYISVNMQGTVAYVQSEKRVSGEIPKESTSPSNIVASEDGKIVRLEVHSGDAVCALGQTVEKGQLLISGFDETKNSGTKVVRAKGNVFAVVRKDFCVTYPFVIQRKLYTGRQYTVKEYSVCGKSIKTSEKEQFELCDVTKEKKKLTVFNSVTLPVYITETTYREYVYEEYTLDEGEALRQAKILYLEKLQEVTGSSDVLQREVRTEKNEDGVTISCTLEMISSIAKEEKITVSTP